MSLLDENGLARVWSKMKTWVGNQLPGDFSGATTASAGIHGLVPAPTTTDTEKFLRGDGSWADGSTDVNVTQTNTTTNADYRILLSGSADNTTRTEGTGKSSKFTANPSTGAVTFGSRVSNSVIGDYSFAQGSNVTASDSHSHAEGNGTTASGYAAHVEGFYSIASGNDTHAEGNNTTASGNNAHAEGYGTIASGYATHAEGNNNIASSDYAHAEGNGTTARGQGAHAEGYKALASGDFAHAEGSLCIATDAWAHAEGSSSQASGRAAHAEGASQATAWYSHAEGNSCWATGLCAHAEGNLCKALGKWSHAQGKNTVASHQSQHVFGEYNIIDDSENASTAKGNYVEIVGNGLSSTQLSNARTLDWSGNEVLSGKLTVGTAPTTDMDVTTKKYVDDAVGELSSSLAKVKFTKFTYTYDAVTIQANSNVTVNATNSKPSNLTHIAVEYFNSGNGNAFFRYINAGSGAMNIHNNSSSAITITPTLVVTCVDSTLV